MRVFSLSFFVLVFSFFLAVFFSFFNNKKLYSIKLCWVIVSGDSSGKNIKDSQ